MIAFLPVSKYFKKIANTNNNSAWKSKRPSDESISPPNNNI